MGILSILGALTGLIDPVGRIIGQIADAREKKAQAQSDSERIAADERIAALEATRDVLIARSGNKIDAIVRALFAVPVAIYCAKLYLWDKVLGWGVTDALSPWLSEVAMIIIGGYFLHAAASRALKR